MGLRCEDCRNEIKAAPVQDESRCFCNRRCQEQWKRRMARFWSERQQPVAFGDA
jgi:NAD-dependent DNA ligase